jgi:hypothetical protein
MKLLLAGGLLATTTALTLSLASGERQPVSAGFWFDPVSFEAQVLGGALTADDLRTIETTAREELATAFGPFDIVISARRDVRYHVRVVQEVLDHRIKGKAWVAGQSHAMRGFGGSGSVSFIYFASGALSYAPPTAARREMVEAIGRGIGRGAAHEFAHQFLIGKELHGSRDHGSYEYHAASRPEQYYGPMHWDVAGPMLQERLGRR